MAEWSVSALTPAADEKAQLYTVQAFHQAKVNSFVGQLMGEGPNNIVQTDKRLELTKGSAVNLPLVTDIDSELGLAASSSNDLEGAEVAPTVHGEAVLLDGLRQAIRLDGNLSEQRASFNMREEIRDKLAYWAQRRLFDGPFFRKMSGLNVVDKDAAVVGEAASANTTILYGGTGNSAVNDLVDGDTITFEMLQDAKTVAESGFNGTTALISKIRPVNIEGMGEHYVYVGHQYDRALLKKQDEWKNTVNLAEVRGKENPRFTGEIRIWDNILLYFHDQVVLQNNATSVQYSTGLFLGAQAGYWIQAQPAPDWVEKEFDYKWKYGIGTSFMFGFDKVKFNSLDFGCIAIKAAAKNPLA